jgi:hypothetical protein
MAIEPALITMALAAILVWIRWSNRGWMPLELRRGALAFAEKLFRTEGQVILVARVDRAYRVKGKGLILVELKTRRANRHYLSDVIELSAQRVAIMRQIGEEVSMRAYVVVRTENGKRAAHKVDLLSTAQIDALIDRRAAILEGLAQPRRAYITNLCRQCGFRGKCTYPPN